MTISEIVVVHGWQYLGVSEDATVGSSTVAGILLVMQLAIERLFGINIEFAAECASE